ncbi:MAG: PEP-CTERM sorting domain-containing protein [Chthonomonas sp.]|nr:PEP-CTERM sorting domain-containing protein [Chthonomonas sp.]
MRGNLRTAFALSALLTTLAWGQPIPPALSSRPGAQYTIYLNFAGFNYSGTWANRTPGNVPAFTLDGDATTFTSAEMQRIRETWARAAAAFVGFNINVTTVDPAPAGLTHAERKTWYDNTQYLTHTILGGSNSWYGSAGGVSYVGIAEQATTTNGRRTNWVFPAGGSGTSAKAMGFVAAHEDGHHLGLPHQHDENTGGEYSSNGGASGDGSYAPIMGTAYNSQRATWRVGTTGTNVNDVAVLLNNLNIGPLIDDGISHTMASATPMAVLANGTSNAAQNRGWILPRAETNYAAEGANAYTKDFFKFRTLGGTVSLTANDGTSFLIAGVADGGATMRSSLRIFNSSGSLVGVATESASTLVHTWTGSLTAGDYYAEVTSVGAYTSGYEPNARYFNMGAYFITGSGLAPVPEPVSLISLGAGLVVILRRRRNR